MAQRGIASGARVRVRSRVGSVETEALASDEMMPGVVCLPHGWGHDRAGTRVPVASAQAGVSQNDLTDPQRLDFSGNAALNGTPVVVERL
jgi:anaerobic selenocysteine-containing dehydrogenase